MVDGDGDGDGGALGTFLKELVGAYHDGRFEDLRVLMLFVEEFGSEMRDLWLCRARGVGEDVLGFVRAVDECKLQARRGGRVGLKVR